MTAIDYEHSQLCDLLEWLTSYIAEPTAEVLPQGKQVLVSTHLKRLEMADFLSAQDICDAIRLNDLESNDAWSKIIPLYLACLDRISPMHLMKVHGQLVRLMRYCPSSVLNNDELKALIATSIQKRTYFQRDLLEKLRPSPVVLVANDEQSKTLAP